MQGSAAMIPGFVPHPGGSGDQGMARRLAYEFSAPVGLLDPVTLTWQAREGIADARFPDADASLTAALATGVLWHGRVSSWRPGRDAGPTWLCLPVPRADGTSLLALVGFAADPSGTAEGGGPHVPTAPCAPGASRSPTGSGARPSRAAGRRRPGLPPRGANGSSRPA